MTEAILRLFGWTVEHGLPDTAKCVAIGAPHTSNWDFPVGILVIRALGIQGRWVGKHTLFRPPLGVLMRALGGIPLDRRRASDFVARMVKEFRRREAFVLVIAPEGTRSRTEHWRTGFYHVARQAGVPIALGYVDFPRKRAGVGGVLEPTGDIEADFRRLRAFYADKVGKRPEKTGAIRPRPHPDP